MKNQKSKSKIKIVSLFLVFLIHFSCSKEDNQISNSNLSLKLVEQFIYNTDELYNSSENYQQKSSNFSKRDWSDPDFLTLKYVFTPDVSMPTFESEEDLKDFIVENHERTSGVFELYWDNELVYKCDVVDGQIFNRQTFINEVSPGSNYPCTYRGIKQCAIDRIHNLNWFDKTRCILSGLGCVMENYASCAADYCFK